MAKEISQSKFEEASQLFDMIADVQRQLAQAKTLKTKLLLRRRIIALIAKRRKVLGLDD